MGFPHVAGQRYRMAQRMGGAISGRDLGNHLIDAGLDEDTMVEKLIHFMNHCKVGKVSMDKTVKIKENCEGLRTKNFAEEVRVPSCYFTTGFLNGFFSSVRGQKVRETRCIVTGDPYCEWQFT